jgi:hypothetical protein
MFSSSLFIHFFLAAERTTWFQTERFAFRITGYSIHALDLYTDHVFSTSYLSLQSNTTLAVRASAMLVLPIGN